MHGLENMSMLDLDSLHNDLLSASILIGEWGYGAIVRDIQDELIGVLLEMHRRV